MFNYSVHGTGTGFSLGQNQRRQPSPEPNPSVSSSPLGVINEGATISGDDINN